ncbi:MAG: SgcJ/EcaC family oxidoreductase [Steroidobacteraceae bacterium]
MKLLRRSLVLSICTSAMALPAGATDSSPTRNAALIATAEQWAEAYGRGDLDKIAGMYTIDAKLLPEGRESITGRDAILDFFRKLRSPQSTEKIRFSNFEFYGNDTATTEVSDFEISDHGKPVSRGKQILIRLKQADGGWKIHRDIWTMNGS